MARHSEMFHFTCDHGLSGILKTWTVKPSEVTGLAWFTDLREPTRDQLGLTSHLLSCDRMAHRVTVLNVEHIVAWGQIRSRFPQSFLDSLELPLLCEPAHWFVSEREVKVFDVQKV